MPQPSREIIKHVKPGMGSAPAVVLSNPKYPHNVGSVVRAASCFNIPQVWFSGSRVSLEGDGKRYRLPREERLRGYGDVSLYSCDRPFDAFTSEVTPVAVELVPGAESLVEFEHPDNAVYVFGPEDGSLDRMTLGFCHRFVQIPSKHCFNLAGAVYITLYDRHQKRVLSGKEEPLNVMASMQWDEPDEMFESVGVE